MTASALLSGACGPSSSLSSFVVSGQNQDAIYTGGERTGDFDLRASSYAVRWSIDKAKPCAASLILSNSQSEQQAPIVFELTPSADHSGAFNLKPDANGKHYLSAQVGKDCGYGAWSVTFTPASEGNAPIVQVAATPPSQSTLAAAYHQVVDPDVASLVTTIQSLNTCTNSSVSCLVDFYIALGQQADKASADFVNVDVPRCLTSANDELTTAIADFSQSSRSFTSAVLANDPGAAQSATNLFGQGIDHFNTARSLLAQASCI